MPLTPLTEKTEKIQQEARDAALRFSDLNAACPYPFSSDEGWIFRAAFIDARRRQGAPISESTATPRATP